MNKCKSCEEETKPDEWSNYDKKICIDCEQELRHEYNSECGLDTADMVVNED